MIGLIFSKSIEEYKNNFKVMLSYGVLFVFVIFFLFLNQFFLSSGTVHLVYGESILSVIGLIFSLVFLYFFSFFVSLTVYSTKRGVQKVSFDTYWNVLLKKVSVTIFSYYVLLFVVIYFLMFAGLYFNFLFFATILSLIFSILLIFVPQSIILDESNLFEAMIESVLFWKNNFLVSLAIVLIGTIFLFLIIFLEFLLELFLLPGTIVSFFLVLAFLTPFVEQMKSYSFILRFNLIKQSEILSAQIKPKKPVTINAVRIREKSKKGKI